MEGKKAYRNAPEMVQLYQGMASTSSPVVKPATTATAKPATTVSSLHSPAPSAQPAKTAEQKAALLAQFEALKKDAGTLKDRDAVFEFGKVLIEGKIEGKKLFTPSVENLRAGLFYLLNAEKLGHPEARKFMDSHKDSITAGCGTAKQIKNPKPFSSEVAYASSKEGIRELNETNILNQEIRTAVTHLPAEPILCSRVSQTDNDCR